MTARAMALAALLAGLPLAARGEAARAPAPAEERGTPVGPLLRRAVAALDDEDVPVAEALVTPALAAHPEDRAVLAVAGIVRFYEQRYGEAADLLEKGGLPTGDIDYLALARAARDLTRGHERVEAEHFVVSFPRGKDEVLVPYALEALEAQRRALEEDLGWVPPGRVTVELLDGTGDLARLSTLSEQEIRTSGTIALCKFNKLMIVSPKALVHGYDWLDTAAHEYTHYVVTARTHNRAPVWLQEGIAKYSESRWRGSGGELQPYSARLLHRALERRQLITFEQMHPSLAKLPSQEAAALAFAEVSEAVGYLRKKGGAPVMKAVLERVAAGSSAERAVAAALGVSFDAFLADWKRYLASRPQPEGGEAPPAKLRFRGQGGDPGAYPEWAELADPRARGFARLGEIFRERGRWASARVEYAKALALARTGGAPTLSGKFALAAMMTDRDEEAERALVEALRRSPHHAALHLQYGRLLAKRKAWPQARAELLAANAVDPFDPEIHAALAAVCEAQGDAGAASREARFARLLAGQEGG